VDAIAERNIDRPVLVALVVSEAATEPARHAYPGHRFWHFEGDIFYLTNGRSAAEDLRAISEELSTRNWRQLMFLVDIGREGGSGFSALPSMGLFIGMSVLRVLSRDTSKQQ